MRYGITRFHITLNAAVKDAEGDIDVAIRRMSEMASAGAWLDSYIGRQARILDIEKFCAETLRDNPDLEEDALIAEALRRMETDFPRQPLN